MSFFANELYIEKFRKIENQNISLGRRINVISGQNGVGKSNLMALIASAFGTKDKRLSEGNFHPEFTDFFTIPTNENYKDYGVYIKVNSDFNDNFIGKHLSLKDDTNSKRGIRIIPRSTKKFNEQDTLNILDKRIKDIYGIGPAQRIPVPTIISTLSRLYPVGETKISNTNINRRKNVQEVKQKYQDYYNSVLENSIETNKNINLINKSTTNKNNIYVDLRHGNQETQSVGQDSLGNIITCITDFYYLKISDPENYKGGILCIDEIDSSLHPSAQVNLMNLLQSVSEDLNLQVFITTHSLTILKRIITFENNNSELYRLIYLIDSESPRLYKYTNYLDLKADLFHEMVAYTPEIKVYCEDDLTLFLFQELLTLYTGRLPKYKIIPIHLGCENLKKLPNQDSYFGKVVIILDGDARINDKSISIYNYINNKTSFTGKKSKFLADNYVYLPSFLAPESYLYFILHEICTNDKYSSYWGNLNDLEDTSFRILTKAKLLNYLLPKNINENTKNDDLKKHFNSNNSSKIDIKKLVSETQILSFYYKENKEEFDKFIKYVQEAFNKVSKYVKSLNY